jgi:hypothetical protein
MLQADGFTGGVPLTDRISGGSLISKTEGAAEPSRATADALDGCQDVSQSDSPSCIQQQGERLAPK